MSTSKLGFNTNFHCSIVLYPQKVMKATDKKDKIPFALHQKIFKSLINLLTLETFLTCSTKKFLPFFRTAEEKINLPG